MRAVIYMVLAAMTVSAGCFSSSGRGSDGVGTGGDNGGGTGGGGGGSGGNAAGAGGQRDGTGASADTGGERRRVYHELWLGNACPIEMVPQSLPVIPSQECRMLPNEGGTACAAKLSCTALNDCPIPGFQRCIAKVGTMCDYATEPTPCSEDADCTELPLGECLAAAHTLCDADGTCDRVGATCHYVTGRCRTDDDCTQRPGGRCVEAVERTECIRSHDCTEDADCGPAQRCGCRQGRGFCVEAQCEVNADCGENLACQPVFDCTGAETGGMACESADAPCRPGDASCPPAEACRFFEGAWACAPNCAID